MAAKPDPKIKVIAENRRGRFGSWLKRLACRYSGMLQLKRKNSSPEGPA